MRSFVILLVSGACCVGAHGMSMDSPRVSSPENQSRPEEIREAKLEVFGRPLHALEIGPSSSEGVLLLHGARFSSETWRELDTLNVLGKAGVRAVALDLPGFGESAALSPRDGVDKGAWRSEVLRQAMDRTGLARAVVVAPSMSGAFLGPFLAEDPDRLLGIVPIAPAAAASFSFSDNRGEHPAAMILWGENDAVFPVEGAATLSAALGNAAVEIFPGGSHACYLDDPEHFHRLLTAFAADLLGD